MRLPRGMYSARTNQPVSCRIARKLVIASGLRIAKAKTPASRLEVGTTARPPIYYAGKVEVSGWRISWAACSQEFSQGINSRTESAWCKCPSRMRPPRRGVGCQYNRPALGQRAGQRHAHPFTSARDWSVSPGLHSRLRIAYGLRTL
jgi:hypothetical protein